MAQIGALFYVAWALLHLYAAFQVYKLGSRQLAGMVRGRIYQGAWNLAYFAVSVAVVAVVFNWFNNLLAQPDHDQRDGYRVHALRDRARLSAAVARPAGPGPVDRRADFQHGGLISRTFLALGLKWFAPDPHLVRAADRIDATV
jgi:hypothetical protein